MMNSIEYQNTEGRRVLLSKKTTKSQFFFLFIVFLPLLFTMVVFLGYTDAKHAYTQSGINAMEKQVDSVLQVIQLMHGQVKAKNVTLAQAEAQLRDLFATPEQDRPPNVRPLAQGEELLVFDSQGRLIIPFSQRGDTLPGMTQPYSDLVWDVLHGEKSPVTYSASEPGKSGISTKIAAIRYFPQWDWHIALVSEETAFYKPFQQVKSFLIMLVVVSYLIAAILYYLTYRKDKAFVSTKLRSSRLAEMNQSILKTLAVALEERDAYTSGHSQRVAYYMRVIGQRLGLDDETLDIMYTGGLLHDIGKIGIEDSILHKPGRLTDEEFEVIKSHPVRGEALLRKLYAQAAKEDAAKIQAILLITRHHHERYDGSGYPDQLHAEEIPLLARISAVADSFDAMTSSRAYRKGLSFSKACDEIAKNAGTQFYPKVVDAFFQSVSEETFLHAHNISRANELLAPIVNDAEAVHTQQTIQG